jgi:MerR family transcriptional regulator, light-induced transcriptional regulator
MSPESTPRLRIGELSRRTGVRTDTLRAWERRYGLLKPERTEGGFRLYDSADEARVRAMKAHIEEGLSASEAARLASVTRPATRAPEGAGEAASLAERVDALQVMFEQFNEAGANTLLDDAFSQFTIETVAGRIVLPVMREIGARWEKGEVSVAQEHFATAVIRGRFVAMARNWGVGGGPRALLACPSGESHDLGLMAFGLVLHGRGWRITYLGADTPIETIASAAAQLHPDAIVLAALDPERFESAADGIRALASKSRLLLAGAGSSEELAERLDARAVADDPVATALELSAA